MQLVLVERRYNTWLYREFLWRRPRWVAVLLPIVVVWVSWLTAMFALDNFPLFEDKYFMTITMLFGAFPSSLLHQLFELYAHYANSKHGGRGNIRGCISCGISCDDAVLPHLTQCRSRYG